MESGLRVFAFGDFGDVGSGDFVGASLPVKGQSVADPKELDGDVILAAQARHAGAVVITENLGHLARFVEFYDWRDTPVADLLSK